MNTYNMINQEFKFWQDWDKCEGGLDWKDAKTLKRYNELNNQHAPAKGWFVAFNDEQFAKGLSGLIDKGEAKSKDEIIHLGAGVFGTRAGLQEMVQFYQDRSKRIAEECDPQEVYRFEFNNHECMIAYDGDLEAMRLCIDLFGKERCKSIKRFCAFYTFAGIAKN